jgi:diguanylate cyclase (GGDEF)-like protein/PAS domain S-box-containing protein
MEVRKKLVKVLEHSSDAVLLVDGNRQIVWLNERAKILLPSANRSAMAISDLLPDCLICTDSHRSTGPIVCGSWVVASEPVDTGWIVLLKPNEERLFLGSFLKTIPAPAFLKDRTGRFVDCNDSFLEFLGQKKGEVLGKTVFDIAPLQLAEIYSRMDEDLFPRGVGATQRYEADLRDASGRIRRVLFHKSNFSDGSHQVVGLMGIIFDVTELRQAERSATLAHQRLRDAIESIEDGFALFDAEDRLVICNAPLANILHQLNLSASGPRPSFIELTTRAVANGIIQIDDGDQQQWLSRRIAAHRNPPLLPLLYRLADGRKIRVVERKTADGGIVGVYSDVTGQLRYQQDLEEARRRAELLALHDPLTNLPNRQLLQDRIAYLAARHRRDHRGAALFFLDLDGFKEVNDRKGHDQGDEVLKNLARLLLRSVRDCDTVARFGGDEFVILADISNDGRTEAENIAQRILENRQADEEIGEPIGDVTISMGIALFPQDHSNIDTVFHLADQALRRAKARGKNTFLFHEL